MSGPFDAKYTDEQREAAGVAYIEGMTAREVVQAAADGRLKHQGEQLEPFTITPSYVADLGAKVKRRRAGKADTTIADMPPRDAIETLRRRLLNVAHQELEIEERKKPGKRDAARIREWTRCVFEASRLPGPSDTRPKPSTVKDETGTKVRTHGGAAGALMREHRAQTASAQDETHTNTNSGDIRATQHAHADKEAQQQGEPGALRGERSPELEALAVGG